MEHFLFKLLPLFVLYFISFTNQVNCNEVISSASLKIGEVLQCTVRGKKIHIPCTASTGSSDINVTTLGASDYRGYKLYPMKKDQKCLSFQVRSGRSPHLLFSATPTVNTAERFEVILDLFGRESIIRNKNMVTVNSTPTHGIVDDKTFHAFWMNWENNLLLVGKNTESKPFLQYQFPGTIPANYIGVLGYLVPAEWIIHAEPKCGPYEINEEEVELECKY